jgi:hypothetical protein
MAEGVSFRHTVQLLREDNTSPATAATMMPVGPHSVTTGAGGVKRSKVPKFQSPLDVVERYS